jgi:hypothetical protein
MHRKPNALFAILSSFLCLSFALKAEARLGEPIANFKARNAGHYQLKSEKKKDQSTSYYIFSLIIDKEQREAAPNLAGGITITVTNGHITGQSLALRFDSGSEAEKLLGVAHCLEFVYEAIGKRRPLTKTAQDNELNAFTAGVNQALAGSPQCVRYPGFHAKITLSRTTAGDLVVGVSPEKLS